MMEAKGSLCAVERKIKPMAFLTYVDVNDSKHNAYYVFHCVCVCVCSNKTLMDIMYVSQSELALSNAKNSKL